MKEVNKNIVMSDSYKAMESVKDEINYILENAEFNENILLLDADNLLAYEEVVKNDSLSGLYLENKGFETLIIGGVDYNGTLQYRDVLLSDEKLRKQHLMVTEKEDTSNPFINYVIAYAKTLRNDEYGFIRNNKDMWTVMPFYNSNER